MDAATYKKDNAENMLPFCDSWTTRKNTYCYFFFKLALSDINSVPIFTNAFCVSDIRFISLLDIFLNT